MFDKIPSLKDFILYLMPGILISYFGLNIFNLVFSCSIEPNEMFSNNVLIFIGIILSFSIGFLFSQLQIMLFNSILRKKYQQLRSIDGSQSSKEIKNVLLNRIISEFQLYGIDRNVLLHDNTIIFTCLHFVKIKTNEESQIYIDRFSNLSSFACTLFLPILLGITNILILLPIEKPLMLSTILVSFLVVFYLIRKITVNFRDEWFKGIFRQFLILSRR